MPNKIGLNAQWFHDGSPVNLKIENNPSIASYSPAAMAAFLTTSNIHININQWNLGSPAIILGNSATDRVQDVSFNDGQGNPWILKDVPLPSRLIDYALYRVANGDGDGMVCLWDEAKNGFYSFWQPRYENEVFTITFGGFSPINNAGFSIHKTKSPVEPDDTPSLGRASGANYATGLIRKEEIVWGKINHAIAMAWPHSLTRGYSAVEPFVFPANTTDGGSDNANGDAVPMGARLQLDPTLTTADLTAMGMNGVDIIICKALQEYGAYIVDTLGIGSNYGAIYMENLITSPQSNSFGATSAWSGAILSSFRFIDPPRVVQLDTANQVGTPVPVL